MSRYIDADALLAKQETIELPDPYGGEYQIDIVHSYYVKNAPTADVVEVVRCRDCAHYIEIPGFVYNNKNAKHCAWHSALRYADDYCSDGWRKENGESI